MEVGREIYFGSSRQQKSPLQSRISTLEKYQNLEEKKERKKEKGLNAARSVKISNFGSTFSEEVICFMSEILRH